MTERIPERILMQDPNIAIVIFFGRGRFNTGVLVQPTASFDPSDAEKVNAFRDLVWPTVSRMNDYAPAHSRLFKHVSSALGVQSFHPLMPVAL